MTEKKQHSCGLSSSANPVIIDKKELKMTVVTRFSVLKQLLRLYVFSRCIVSARSRWQCHKTTWFSHFCIIIVLNKVSWHFNDTKLPSDVQTVTRIVRNKRNSFVTSGTSALASLSLAYSNSGHSPALIEQIFAYICILERLVAWWA